MKPSDLVMLALEPELLARGFRKKRGRRYELDLTDDSTGGIEVWFTTAHTPGVAWVDPSVYVVNWPVSRVIANSLGERVTTLPRGMLGERLTYLVPERRQHFWEIDTQDVESVEGNVADIAGAIDGHALPWMHDRETLATFAREIWKLGALFHNANWSRPVLRLMLEGAAAADEELAVTLARFAESQAQPPAGQIDRYVMGFRRYLAEFSVG